MGIYTSGRIFGLRIYNFNNGDDFANTLFEEKYDDIMSNQQMREAYLFYKQLNDVHLHFQIYTECSSTFNKDNTESYMDWCPLSLGLFLENFGIE